MTLIDWSGQTPIQVLENVDAEFFHSEIAPRYQPAVLKNFAAHWPVTAKAKKSPQDFCDYVASFGAGTPVKAFFAPPEVNGRYFYSDDLKGFNFERRELALGELLDTLLGHIGDDNAPGIYAGAIPLRGELERFLAENRNELLDQSVEQLISIWIGNRGRTAAHWDLPQNIACVVSGRRRFMLFPPEQLANLYVGPIDFTLAGQPISLVDFHEPDMERFPRFSEALANAMIAELGPGDAIFIPSMWFHYVENLDDIGALVNFWWRDSAPYMFSPIYTLIHALMSIRDMPESERETWRAMFDHYIFRASADSLDHIEEDARGALGKMTPERLARIRANLVPVLGGKPR